MKFLPYRLVSTICFLGFYCGLATPVFADDAIKKIKRTQELNISYNDAARPFSYHSHHSHQQYPIGYAIDICKKVASHIQTKLAIPNLKTNFIAVKNYDRLSVLINNQIDFECSSEPLIEKPRLGVALTHPYFFKRTLMMLKKTNPILYWEDLAKRKIAFVQGSDSIHLVREYTKTDLTKSSLIGELSVRIAFDLLANDQVDALISDEVSLYSLKAGSHHTNEFVVKGEALGQQPISIIVKMQNQKLKKLIDSAMSELIQTGELAHIYQQWWKQPLPTHPINYQLPMHPLIIQAIE